MVVSNWRDNPAFMTPGATPAPGPTKDVEICSDGPAMTGLVVETCWGASRFDFFVLLTVTGTDKEQDVYFLTTEYRSGNEDF